MNRRIAAALASLGALLLGPSASAGPAEPGPSGYHGLASVGGDILDHGQDGHDEGDHDDHGQDEHDHDGDGRPDHDPEDHDDDERSKPKEGDE